MEPVGDEYPIVGTTLGQVRGKQRTTVYGDQYYCFDGIPYAQPPVGQLRFASPQPAKPWQGILDCFEVAPKCKQYNRYKNSNEGSEDCLYLNIYAKVLKSDKPLPVMVYLHGGGFSTGSASREDWGPDYFMMKDVIFITIGYRLGIFGFFSLPDPELEVPGNAGLKDIVLALRWIKKNCHKFNGDAENITLFGNSTGSVATQLLMLSPQCEGLFHKTILMSGLSIHLHRPAGLEYRCAKHIGYTGEEDNVKILEYMRTVDADKLCPFSENGTAEEKKKGYDYAFTPTIEYAESTDAILKQDVLDALADQRAWSASLPVMLGGVSQEALIYYKFYTKDATLYSSYNEHPEYLVPFDVQNKCKLRAQQEFGKQLTDLHFGLRKVSMENAECAIQLRSYKMIYHPMHRFLRSRLSTARASTYLYRFDFDSPTFNLYRIKQCGPNVRGVGHVDELSYIFYMSGSYKLPYDSDEYRTIERMIEFLTRFAATGDPNGLAGVTWLPLSKGRRICLNISNELKCIEWPELKICEAWDKLYEKADLRVV